MPGLPREIDPRAIDAYLTYQYVPHPRTIYQGISKLPPAGWAVLADGALSTGSYWRPDFAHEQDLPPADAIDALRQTLTDAVRLRLQSDVPVGTFLSGGVDSSIVTALAQRHTTEPIQTFSIGFAEPAFDETRYARLVAERCGTLHREARLDHTAWDLLPSLVEQYDEPFGDSSALPTYAVSRLARQQVTVALTGDGGDELFAGYERYRAVRLAEQLDQLPAAGRRLLTAGIWPGLAACGSRKFAARLARFGRALGETPERRYAQWMSVFTLPERAALYSDEFVARLGGADPFQFLADAYALTGRRDAVTAASLVDVQTYLPCDLLCKVDMASMAHGLECRQPLLDHRVAELAIGLPLRYKLRQRESKWLLKQAFADLLPPPIARRKKMGFGVPLAGWFRGPLRDAARTIADGPAHAGPRLLRAGRGAAVARRAHVRPARPQPPPVGPGLFGTMAPPLARWSGAMRSSD